VEEGDQMNAVLDAIEKRRSVRSYQDQEVPRGIVEAVIEAGNWAPSGHNLQNWRFVVVENESFRSRLLTAARPKFRKWVSAARSDTNERNRRYLNGLFSRCLGWEPDSYEAGMDRMLAKDDGVYWGAPVVIFVIGGPAMDCGMVCQNMALAAQSLGLGSCIVGFGSMVKDDPEIVEALELRENERIYGPVVIGYPNIVPEPPVKRPPVVKWI
jgi:nitroreductase